MSQVVACPVFSVKLGEARSRSWKTNGGRHPFSVDKGALTTSGLPKSFMTRQPVGQSRNVRFGRTGLTVLTWRRACTFQLAFCALRSGNEVAVAMAEGNGMRWGDGVLIFSVHRCSVPRVLRLWVVGVDLRARLYCSHEPVGGNADGPEPSPAGWTTRFRAAGEPSTPVFGRALRSCLCRNSGTTQNHHQ